MLLVGLYVAWSVLVSFVFQSFIVMATNPGSPKYVSTADGGGDDSENDDDYVDATDWYATLPNGDSADESARGSSEKHKNKADKGVCLTPAPKSNAGISATAKKRSNAKSKAKASAKRAVKKPSGKITVSLSDSDSGSCSSDWEPDSPRRMLRLRQRQSAVAKLNSQPAEIKKCAPIPDRFKEVCSKCARAIRGNKGYPTKRKYFQPGGKYEKDTFEEYRRSETDRRSKVSNSGRKEIVFSHEPKSAAKKTKDRQHVNDVDSDFSWDSVDEYVKCNEERALVRDKSEQSSSASATPPPQGKGQIGSDAHQCSSPPSPSSGPYESYYKGKGKSKGKSKVKGKIAKNKPMKGGKRYYEGGKGYWNQDWGDYYYDYYDGCW